MDPFAITAYLAASLLAPEVAPPSDDCALPEAAPLEIEVVDTVASEKANAGDKFRVRLAAPVMVDGRLVLSAGTPGIGQVIHAMKRKTGGRAGELILAARYLQVGDVQVLVRGFRINVTGRQISGSTVVMGVTALETREGLETEVPAGTVASGKVAQATVVPCAEAPQS